MLAFLNTTFKILAYGDRSVNSNPRLRFADWTRDQSGIPVTNPCLLYTSPSPRD